ncbi:MAG: hypothetical protein Q9193_001288, partial [Seirophora villosa]
MFEVNEGMEKRCTGRNHEGPGSECEMAFKSILVGVARKLGYRGPPAKLHVCNFYEAYP